MNLKTAFIGLAGVLAIPVTIAINGAKADISMVNHAADAVAGQTSATADAAGHTTGHIESRPDTKSKLDVYEPKQP